MQECREAGLSFQIIRGRAHVYAYAPHPLALLRASRERPRHCHTAEQRDELAAPDASHLTSPAKTSCNQQIPVDRCRTYPRGCNIRLTERHTRLSPKNARQSKPRRGALSNKRVKLRALPSCAPINRDHAREHERKSKFCFAVGNETRNPPRRDRIQTKY